MVGYQVQVLGRYNKWAALGLYGDRESAQFYIDRIGKPKAQYRIVNVPEWECQQIIAGKR